MAKPEAGGGARGTAARKSTRRAQARRNLVIVESPAKAETISRFLGDDYRVEACYGHVRDLPGKAEERPAAIKGKPWADLGVNVDDDFEPVYIVPADKRPHIKRLKQALKSADKLLLATDEDREGESIGWHLTEVLAPKVPVERIVFHEVTPEAIEAALQAPRQVDRNLVQAQESRRILDRLFGYSLSPVLWRKVQTGLSAGRVQSVAVRLLVQRERARAAFRRAAYWDAEARLAADQGSFSATLKQLGDERLPSGRDFDPASGALQAAGVRLLDEAALTTLVEQLRRAEPWRVRAVEATPLTRRPAPPFTTSSLQQEAHRKLSFSVSRTMQVAQSLYEGVDMGAEREGLITYMRTDSVRLARPALAAAQALIKERFGADFSRGPRIYHTRTRNAQEAHEAIRPTHLERTPDTLRRLLNDDQYRLYELIWQRTLASQMTDARLERTVVEVEAPSPAGAAVFEARGLRLLFPGYRRAYSEGRDDADADDGDERTLPPLKTGETVRPTAVEPKRHETQPPARFTEASLVRKLEEEGLGRPSTYAAILSTIEDRGYTMKQGAALAPTFPAYAVTELLERHFTDLVDPHFTAEMEDTLDAIAQGQTDSLSHLRAFYRGDDGQPGLVARIEAALPDIDFPAIAVADDPESGQPIVVRIGRFGPYLQRGEGGPGNTASLPPDLAPADLSVERATELLAAQTEGPRALGHDPDSGHEILLQSGRYGPYVQLGPNPPPGGNEARPKRASLPPGIDPLGVTLEDALLWLSLPRTLGVDPATDEAVIAASGRYGPYVQRGAESRSLEDSDDVYAIDLQQALALLAQPKSARPRRRTAARVIAELGSHPASGQPLRILDGRYGPYVTDGETNASIPRATDPATVTLDRAVTLLAERAAAPKGRRRGAKKRAARATKRPAARKRSGPKRPSD